MKNKHLGKKTLSVFLAALMLMTCWVWFAPTEAEALSGTYYGKPEVNGVHFNTGTTAAYSTPIFDGNLDRWFKWQNGNDWTTVYYPSHIYLDKSETLQSAGYYFNVNWHFGSGASYRILLGANVWGDNTAWASYGDGRIRTMNNIFSDYAVDASCTDTYYTAGDGGLYNGGSNYDVRIVGYGYSSQGTDGFNQNGIRHDKYVLLRSRADQNNATIYLKGTPNSSYVGKTTAYNTSGGSFGSYGLCQEYGNNNSWSTHGNGTAQFNSKGSSSNYMEGEWIEMAWDVTVYDKSALNTAIDTASGRVNNAYYTRVYKDKLNAALSTARAVLTKRATNQTEIDNAKNALQTLINYPEYRTYEITYENLFSLSDWWNSNSAINGGKRTVTVDLNAGKVTIQNHETVSSSEVVTNHSGSSNAVSTRDTANYAIPVTGGKSYTFKYSTDHKDTQMFAFFYDVNGRCTHSSTFGNYNFAAPQNGTGTATFTAPANSAQMEIRFDNNWYSSTANYWDIMVYEADRAEEIELDTWTARPIRKLYNYNQTSADSAGLDQPARPAYTFDKWTNADGSPFTATVMTSSKVLYSTWLKSGLDIGYDNIFSLSDWALTNSNKVNDKATGLNVDLEAGTIAVTGMTDAYTTYGGGSDQYHIPVTAGETYIFDYDVTSTNGTYQAFVFFYNDAGSGVISSVQNAAHIGYYNGQPITFTVPEGCTKIGIRVGICGTTEGTATYSNIGIYKKADYDAYAKNYSKVREPFKVGDTKNLMYPSRDGYVFNGWELANGTKIESVTGLTDSTTVYATWTKQWTVTFLNGNGSVLGTSTVKNGDAAKAPQATATKASDANYSYTFSSWDKDFSNVTEDMTVTPKFTSKAHTVTYSSEAHIARTCEKNAIVDKYCADCRYYFFREQEYDGTEIAEYIKLGHSYDETRIVNGTSTGPNGTHEIECVRYLTCGSTQPASHNYAQGTTDNADCITPGTVNWRCPCGQTKTTTGATAPDVHNNTRTINAKDPECLVDGYTGDTYCDDCETIVTYGKAIAQRGHSFTNYVYNEDAECEIDGSETAKCDRCDVTDTQPATGTALKHNWTDTEKYLKSAANCTDDEVYYKECSLCNISSQGKTDATWTKANTKWNHKFDGDYVTNNNGTHVQKCTNTGCTATGNENDCDYGDWTTDNAVTHSHTCEDCEYTPEAEDHDWTAWAPVDADATTSSAMTRECKVCHKEENKNCTYATTHFDATCATPERTEYKCSDCGHGYTVIGEAATGHDFTGDYTYNAEWDAHQQLCANGCGKYGIGTSEGAETPCSWAYANKEAGKHTASCVCGNSQEENCSGGQATCTAAAVCEKCTTAYGTTTDHSFKGAAVKLEGDVHAYLCEYCGTTTDIYGVGSAVNDTEDCSGGTATCSALAVCDVCEDTHGELDADAHKWGAAVTDTANAGKHIYTCEYDTDHTKNEACVSISSEVVAPKCEEDGYTIQTCKCGYEWNTDTVPATDHNWVDPVDNNDGTHTLSCDNENVDGWVCDETLTLNCAESAITFGLEPATCTEQGYTTYQCTVCNYTWNADFVNATGHSYEKKIRKPDATYKRSDKTCTEAETYWYCCDNCDVSAGTEADKYEDNLASIYWSNGTAVGHKMDKLVDTSDLAKNRKSEATCTAAAVYYYSCSVCGEQDTTQTFSYGSALGHDWVRPGEDELKKYLATPADCITDATYYYVCSRADVCGVESSEGEKKDGETWTDVDSKSGHSLTHTQAKAATCLYDGNLEYWYCSTCKKYFKDEDATEAYLAQSATVIGKLGHDMKTVKAKSPTCEEDGNPEYEYCQREGCTYTTYPGTLPDGYKKTGHKFTGAYYCDTVYGYHSKKCVNDDCTATGIGTGEDAVKYSVEFDGLDNVFKGGEKCELNSSETDTDENGIHSHKLACVCGNETSKAYADNDTFVETVAPTCTDDGYDSHKCPDCDDTWQKNIVTAAGHDWAEKATSNGDGTHSVKCSECDAVQTTQKCSGGKATCKDKAVCEVCGTAYGETTDHTLNDEGWKSNEDATCTEDGTKSQNCSVCNETVTVTDEDSKLGHSMISDYTYDISGWTNKPEDFDKEIKAPTCKDEGLGIIYCVNCDYHKTRTVKADQSAHVWETDDNGELVWTAVSGNCSTGVTYQNTCTVCDDAQTKVVEGDHTWNIAYEFKPTCTKPGIIKYVCYACKTEKVETCDENADLNPVDHIYGDVVDVEANCEEAPHKEETCTVCGFVNKFDFDEAIGAQHTFGKGVNFKGNCETDAYTEYTCTECNYEEIVVTDKADGHNDANNDGKCDDCRGVMYDDSDSSKGCGCICHKSNWLMKFIYKIINVFWKLFRISKSCECGFVHW